MTRHLVCLLTSHLFSILSCTQYGAGSEGAMAVQYAVGGRPMARVQCSAVFRE